VSAVDAGPEREGQDGRGRVRVFAADDHPLFLRALTRVIEASPELELVGTAGDGERALEMIRSTQPDVTVLDMRMPKLDGRQLLARLRDEDEPTRVLFVSEYVAGDLVLQALQAGCCGYLPKSSTATEIRNAILRVGRGESVLPTAVGSELAGALRERGPAPIKLSPRERSVLELLAEGGSAGAIAQRLGLAVPTVKTHIQSLYVKLGVNDRGAAVAEGIRRGLVS
jgi:two-component system nitrate/nitrite response regulator NarL